MITKERTYRGISYQPAQHESASRSYVEHVYRGKHYHAPLNHDVAQTNPTLELHYRGSVYHQRQNEAACSVKN